MYYIVDSFKQCLINNIHFYLIKYLLWSVERAKEAKKWRYLYLVSQICFTVIISHASVTEIPFYNIYPLMSMLKKKIDLAMRVMQAKSIR